MSAISTWHPSDGAAPPVGERLLPSRARSRPVRWMVLAIGIAIVLGAGWWVTNSPVFDLGTLHVEGNGHLTTKQVVRLAGLHPGTNVLWLSTGAVERRLESDPWVLDATIVRRLPSGITIEIRERVAVGVVVAGGDAPMLIASDGTVLGPASPSVRLPTIAGLVGNASVGARLDPSPELAAAEVLPDRVRRLVASVTRDAGGSIVLIMRDGMTVLYGDASDVAAKGEALRSVLAWAARHDVHPTYVDVRAPTAPAVGTAPLTGVAVVP